MNYYLKLAINGFRRQWTFSVVIVVIISIGIAASTSMMMVLHTLNADPLPSASDRVFHPQLEPSVAGRSASGDELPDALMWDDAMNLLRAQAGKRKATLLEGQVTVVPRAGASYSYFAKALFTQAAFFQMFRVPFASGGSWTRSDDTDGAHVVVVSNDLAQRTFGSVDAVGHTLRLGDVDFRIVGVIGNWNPRPRFYDLANGPFAPGEQIFMPLNTSRALSIAPRSSPACWGDGMPDMAHLDRAPCTWVAFWVELETAKDRDSYLKFLANYSNQQKAAGRFYGAPNVRLSNVSEWLTANRVVPSAARLQSFIAYSFLLICIFNAAGLLMVMFLRRRRELGLRRALGATKRQVFLHLLAETSGLALASAVGGSLLTWAALAILRTRPEAYYADIQVNAWMILMGLLMAIIATLAATFLPAWQVIRGNPYLMLKS
ncbi:ABC transporter permease [Rhodanobacter thiooxydans]|nr:ABC transporter permease [Rhodanobacter thiooxydans]MCW0203065.1 ABC transporter permease [Rhodanobacter thiooxydans]